MAVGGDGIRVAIETPKPFQGIQPGLHSTVRLIREFAETTAALKLTPIDGYLEWSIHYAKSRKKEKVSLTLITDSLNEDE